MDVPPNTERRHSDHLKLLDGESILSTFQHPLRRNHTRPSSLEQLLRLTRATRPEDIGRTGPSIAALSFATDTIPEHLRLYEVVFGRDSLRVAIDLISSYPELARTTLLELAQLQGVDFEQSREEEPGRIVHEARRPEDPIAQNLTQELGWGWPYYGSVDATPEFIRTLTAYTQRTEENRAFLSQLYIDRTGTQRTIAHAFEMALAWIASRRSNNPEGLVEYKSVIPRGIENQVWKDSWDAYHHADGTLANHEQGIASIEVQVTTFDALIDAAEIYEDVFDEPVKAEALRKQADDLKQAIFTHFWTNEKGGYFVLGTDRDETGALRQLKIRTSNMGHTLNSRLLKGDDETVTSMREAIMKQMHDPSLLCPAGIRTLASDELRFRPGAYHNGSVWLWDTHHIAKGMRRLGFEAEADQLDQQVLNVINTTHMFPEYVRGEPDTIEANTETVVLWDERNNRKNKLEQPPQEVQAWTVAAIRAIRYRLERKNTPSA
jgi:glycogen debranching enzyme